MMRILYSAWNPFLEPRGDALAVSEMISLMTTAFQAAIPCVEEEAAAEIISGRNTRAVHAVEAAGVVVPIEEADPPEVDQGADDEVLRDVLVQMVDLDLIAREVDQVVGVEYARQERRRASFAFCHWLYPFLKNAPPGRAGRDVNDQMVAAASMPMISPAA